jgi:putative sterol carrier protein
MNPLVECHSGYEYAERPTAFWVEDVRHEVSRIVKEWNDPNGKHFLVENETGDLYQLDHLSETSDWLVQAASQSMNS